MKRRTKPYFDHDGEPLLTAQQAADRLGVNVETVRRWVRKGSVRYVEIGPNHLRRLRQSDVDGQRKYCGAA